MLRNVLIILAIVFLAIVAIYIIFPIIGWAVGLLFKIIKLALGVALLALILVAIAYLYKKLR